jgi:hypothetical protein
MPEDKIADNKIQKFFTDAENDPDLKGFSKNHKRQLYALKVCYGFVAKAAKMLGINRATYYYNCENNEKYKAAFDAIKEMRIDVIEDALIQNAIGGDTTAQMYYLNCQAGHRGYYNSRKLDVTTKGESLNKGFFDFLKEVAKTDDGSGS